jgi:hypothetical protein
MNTKRLATFSLLSFLFFLGAVSVLAAKDATLSAAAGNRNINLNATTKNLIRKKNIW